MTLGLLELLSVVGVPLLLGAALLRLQGLGPRSDRLAFLGWAWIQGSIGLALGLSAWLWLGLPLRASWLVPAFLTASVLAWGGAHFGRVPVLAPALQERSFPRWERLLLALALLGTCAALLDRILLANRLVVVSDEAVIWAARAKILFHAGGFNEAFRRGFVAGDFLQHPDYPPLNPLLQLWVHAHAGEIVHLESRLPIQLFGLAGLLVAASALRRRARPGVAALFVVCLGTLGFTEASMRKATADILIATGALVAWDLWQRWREEREAAWLKLMATSALLLVWSKNEGLLHVLAFGLALAVVLVLRRQGLPRARRATLAAWCAPLALSIGYLLWFNLHFGVTNDLVSSWTALDAPADPVGRGRGLSLERMGARVGPILESFWTLAAHSLERTHGFLLLFLLLTLLDPLRAFGPRRATFTLGLLIVLGGYLMVYLGSAWDVRNHLQHSLHRLVYHLLPAQALWLCLYLVEALPRLAVHGRAARPA